MDPAKKGKALDEDDEFEEFDVDDWGPADQEPSNPQLWDASWDDDSVDDYVGAQVRTAAQKLQQAQASTGQQPQQQQQQPPPQS